MSTNNARPKWWQVYLTFPLLIVLFMVDNRLKLSVRGHQMFQLGIILLVYGLVHLWLRANAKALSNIGQLQFQGTVTVTRIPSYQLIDANDKQRRILQLPNAEIKGTLSNTFEMETIDAEFLPVDEAIQELNKE